MAEDDAILGVPVVEQIDEETTRDLDVITFGLANARVFAGIADLIPKSNTCEELFDAIERLASRVCRPPQP